MIFSQRHGSDLLDKHQILTKRWENLEIIEKPDLDDIDSLFEQDSLYRQSLMIAHISLK